MIEGLLIELFLKVIQSSSLLQRTKTMKIILVIIVCLANIGLSQALLNQMFQKENHQTEVQKAQWKKMVSSLRKEYSLIGQSYMEALARSKPKMTRNQIPSGSVGSNPTDCVIYFFLPTAIPAIFFVFLALSRYTCEHRWFSGRMLACHAGGPGSIPGRCNLLFLIRMIFCRPRLINRENKWYIKKK